MKKFLFSLIALPLFIGCKQNGDAAVAAGDSTATDTKVDYAYTIEHPDGWEWGSKENTRLALLGLKEFEKGNVEGSTKYFGDSVRVEFNGFEAMLSNDSLTSMLKQERSQYKTVTIHMDDFESVKAKDDSIEYVSLWYKQINEGHDGKIDSMEIMDDLRMKNGKIVGLNEKTRRYAKP